MKTANMTNRIHCPFHQENTPSMVLYEEAYHCYGCGAHGPLKDLDNKVSGWENKVNKQPFTRGASWKTRYREDLKKSLERISKLPVANIRGLDFPYDDSGYYIVYPTRDYYIKRSHSVDDPCKYKSPPGHKKPLYQLNTGTRDSVLVIIEGQLNALSAYHAYSKISTNGKLVIVSPGAATDLNKQDLITYYLQYDKICIIVDRDAAGGIEGKALKDYLYKKGKRVRLVPMERDFNEILVQDGINSVYEELKKAVEMYKV
jgi:hypothetical protein